MSSVEKFIVAVLPCVWFFAGAIAMGALSEHYSNIEIGALMFTLLLGGITLLWTVDQLR